MNTRGARPSSERDHSKFAGAYLRVVPLALCFCALMCLAAGCQRAASQPALPEEIDQLKQEKIRLEEQVKQYQSESEGLKKQIEVLSGLAPDERGKNIYDLQRVNVGRYTDLYDKDKDGKKEKLIVYVQPIDEEGDTVKVAGAVDIQLWDLDKADGQALLSQWRVEPAELKKLWYAALISSYYRLTFDIADVVPDFKGPLTVKLTFTDYLTGRVFEDQRVIEPKQE